MSVRKYLREADNRYTDTAAENKEIMRDTVYSILEDIVSYTTGAENTQQVIEYVETIMEDVR